MDEARKMIEELYGEDNADYRAGVLVLEICHAVQDDVILVGVAGTIIEMISDRTGMQRTEIMEILKQAYLEVWV